MLDVDWALCDLEADQWARVDYRMLQEAAAAGFDGVLDGATLQRLRWQPWPSPRAPSAPSIGSALLAVRSE